MYMYSEFYDYIYIVFKKDVVFCLNKLLFCVRKILILFNMF